MSDLRVVLNHSSYQQYQHLKLARFKFVDRYPDVSLNYAYEMQSYSDNGEYTSLYKFPISLFEGDTNIDTRAYCNQVLGTLPALLEPEDIPSRLAHFWRKVKEEVGPSPPEQDPHPVISKFISSPTVPSRTFLYSPGQPLEEAVSWASLHSVSLAVSSAHLDVAKAHAALLRVQPPPFVYVHDRLTNNAVRRYPLNAAGHGPSICRCAHCSLRFAPIPPTRASPPSSVPLPWDGDTHTCLVQMMLRRRLEHTLSHPEDHAYPAHMHYPTTLPTAQLPALPPLPAVPVGATVPLSLLSYLRFLAHRRAHGLGCIIPETDPHTRRLLACVWAAMVARGWDAAVTALSQGRDADVDAAARHAPVEDTPEDVRTPVLLLVSDAEVPAVLSRMSALGLAQRTVALDDSFVLAHAQTWTYRRLLDAMREREHAELLQAQREREEQARAAQLAAEAQANGTDAPVKRKRGRPRKIRPPEAVADAATESAGGAVDSAAAQPSSTIPAVDAVPTPAPADPATSAATSTSDSASNAEPPMLPFLHPHRQPSRSSHTLDAVAACVPAPLPALQLQLDALHAMYTDRASNGLRTALAPLVWVVTPAVMAAAPTFFTSSLFFSLFLDLCPGALTSTFAATGSSGAPYHSLSARVRPSTRTQKLAVPYLLQCSCGRCHGHEDGAGAYTPPQEDLDAVITGACTSTEMGTGMEAISPPSTLPSLAPLFPSLPAAPAPCVALPPHALCAALHARIPAVTFAAALPSLAQLAPVHVAALLARCLPHIASSLAAHAAMQPYNLSAAISATSVLLRTSLTLALVSLPSAAHTYTALLRADGQPSHLDLPAPRLADIVLTAVPDNPAPLLHASTRADAHNHLSSAQTQASGADAPPPRLLQVFPLHAPDTALQTALSRALIVSHLFPVDSVALAPLMLPTPPAALVGGDSGAGGDVGGNTGTGTEGSGMGALHSEGSSSTGGLPLVCREGQLSLDAAPLRDADHATHMLHMPQVPQPQTTEGKAPAAPLGVKPPTESLLSWLGALLPAHTLQPGVHSFVSGAARHAATQRPSAASGYPLLSALLHDACVSVRAAADADDAVMVLLPQSLSVMVANTLALRAEMPALAFPHTHDLAPVSPPVASDASSGMVSATSATPSLVEASAPPVMLPLAPVGAADVCTSASPAMLASVDYVPADPDAEEPPPETEPAPAEPPVKRKRGRHKGRAVATRPFYFSESVHPHYDVNLVALATNTQQPTAFTAYSGVFRPRRLGRSEQALQALHCALVDVAAHPYALPDTTAWRPASTDSTTLNNVLNSVAIAAAPIPDLVSLFLDQLLGPQADAHMQDAAGSADESGSIVSIGATTAHTNTTGAHLELLPADPVPLPGTDGASTVSVQPGEIPALPIIHAASASASTPAGDATMSLPANMLSLPAMPLIEPVPPGNPRANAAATDNTAPAGNAPAAGAVNGGASAETERVVVEGARGPAGDAGSAAGVEGDASAMSDASTISTSNSSSSSSSSSSPSDPHAPTSTCGSAAAAASATASTAIAVPLQLGLPTLPAAVSHSLARSGKLVLLDMLLAVRRRDVAEALLARNNVPTHPHTHGHGHGSTQEPAGTAVSPGAVSIPVPASAAYVVTSGATAAPAASLPLLPVAPALPTDTTAPQAYPRVSLTQRVLVVVSNEALQAEAAALLYARGYSCTILPPRLPPARSRAGAPPVVEQLGDVVMTSPLYVTPALLRLVDCVIVADAADAAALQSLCRELVVGVVACAEGRAGPLPPLPVFLLVAGASAEADVVSFAFADSAVQESLRFDAAHSRGLFLDSLASLREHEHAHAAGHTSTATHASSVPIPALPTDTPAATAADPGSTAPEASSPAPALLSLSTEPIPPPAPQLLPRDVAIASLVRSAAGCGLTQRAGADQLDAEVLLYGHDGSSSGRDGLCTDDIVFSVHGYAHVSYSEATGAARSMQEAGLGTREAYYNTTYRALSGLTARFAGAGGTDAAVAALEALAQGDPVGGFEFESAFAGGYAVTEADVMEAAGALQTLQALAQTPMHALGSSTMHAPLLPFPPAHAPSHAHPHVHEHVSEHIPHPSNVLAHAPEPMVDVSAVPPLETTHPTPALVRALALLRSLARVGTTLFAPHTDTTAPAPLHVLLPALAVHAHAPVAVPVAPVAPEESARLPALLTAAPLVHPSHRLPQLPLAPVLTPSLLAAHAPAPAPLPSLLCLTPAHVHRFLSLLRSPQHAITDTPEVEWLRVLADPNSAGLRPQAVGAATAEAMARPLLPLKLWAHVAMMLAGVLTTPAVLPLLPSPAHLASAMALTLPASFRPLQALFGHFLARAKRVCSYSPPPVMLRLHKMLREQHRLLPPAVVLAHGNDRSRAFTSAQIHEAYAAVKRRLQDKSFCPVHTPSPLALAGAVTCTCSSSSDDSQPTVVFTHDGSPESIAELAKVEYQCRIHAKDIRAMLPPGVPGFTALPAYRQLSRARYWLKVKTSSRGRPRKVSEGEAVEVEVPEEAVLVNAYGVEYVLAHHARERNISYRVVQGRHPYSLSCFSFAQTSMRVRGVPAGEAELAALLASTDESAPLLARVDVNMKTEDVTKEEEEEEEDAEVEAEEEVGVEGDAPGQRGTQTALMTDDTDIGTAVEPSRGRGRGRGRKRASAREEPLQRSKRHRAGAASGAAAVRRRHGEGSGEGGSSEEEEDEETDEERPAALLGRPRAGLPTPVAGLPLSGLSALSSLRSQPFSGLNALGTRPAGLGARTLPFSGLSSALSAFPPIPSLPTITAATGKPASALGLPVNTSGATGGAGLGLSSMPAPPLALPFPPSLALSRLLAPAAAAAAANADAASASTSTSAAGPAEGVDEATAASQGADAASSSAASLLSSLNTLTSLSALPAATLPVPMPMPLMPFPFSSVASALARAPSAATTAANGNANGSASGTGTGGSSAAVADALASGLAALSAAAASSASSSSSSLAGASASATAPTGLSALPALPPSLAPLAASASASAEPGSSPETHVSATDTDVSTAAMGLATPATGLSAASLSREASAHMATTPTAAISSTTSSTAAAAALPTDNPDTEEDSATATTAPHSEATANSSPAAGDVDAVLDTADALTVPSVPEDEDMGEWVLYGDISLRIRLKRTRILPLHTALCAEDAQPRGGAEGSAGETLVLDMTEGADVEGDSDAEEGEEGEEGLGYGSSLQLKEEAMDPLRPTAAADTLPLPLPLPLPMPLSHTAANTTTSASTSSTSSATSASVAASVAYPLPALPPFPPARMPASLPTSLHSPLAAPTHPLRPLPPLLPAPLPALSTLAPSSLPVPAPASPSLGYPAALRPLPDTDSVSHPAMDLPAHAHTHALAAAPHPLPPPIDGLPLDNLSALPMPLLPFPMPTLPAHTLPHSTHPPQQQSQLEVPVDAASRSLTQAQTQVQSQALLPTQPQSSTALDKPRSNAHRLVRAARQSQLVALNPMYLRCQCCRQWFRGLQYGYALSDLPAMTHFHCFRCVNYSEVYSLLHPEHPPLTRYVPPDHPPALHRAHGKAEWRHRVLPQLVPRVDTAQGAPTGEASSHIPLPLPVTQALPAPADTRSSHLSPSPLPLPPMPGPLSPTAAALPPPGPPFGTLPPLGHTYGGESTGMQPPLPPLGALPPLGGPTGPPSHVFGPHAHAHGHGHVGVPTSAHAGEDLSAMGGMAAAEAANAGFRYAHHPHHPPALAHPHLHESPHTGTHSGGDTMGMGMGAIPAIASSTAHPHPHPHPMQPMQPMQQPYAHMQYPAHVYPHHQQLPQQHQQQHMLARYPRTAGGHPLPHSQGQGQAPEYPPAFPGDGSMPAPQPMHMPIGAPAGGYPQYPPQRLPHGQMPMPVDQRLPSMQSQPQFAPPGAFPHAPFPAHPHPHPHGPAPTPHSPSASALSSSSLPPLPPLQHAPSAGTRGYPSYEHMHAHPHAPGPIPTPAPAGAASAPGPGPAQPPAAVAHPENVPLAPHPVSYSLPTTEASPAATQAFAAAILAQHTPAALPLLPATPPLAFAPRTAELIRMVVREHAEGVVSDLADSAAEQALPLAVRVAIAYLALTAPWLPHSQRGEVVAVVAAAATTTALPVPEWSIARVGTWLREMGLSARAVAAAARLDLSGNALLSLSAQALMTQLNVSRVNALRVGSWLNAARVGLALGGMDTVADTLAYWSGVVEELPQPLHPEDAAQEDAVLVMEDGAASADGSADVEATASVAAASTAPVGGVEVSPAPSPADAHVVEAAETSLPSPSTSAAPSTAAHMATDHSSASAPAADTATAAAGGADATEASPPAAQSFLPHTQAQHVPYQQQEQQQGSSLPEHSHAPHMKHMHPFPVVEEHPHSQPYPGAQYPIAQYSDPHAHYPDTQYPNAGSYPPAQAYNSAQQYMRADEAAASDEPQHSAAAEQVPAATHTSPAHTAATPALDAVASTSTSASGSAAILPYASFFAPDEQTSAPQHVHMHELPHPHAHMPLPGQEQVHEHGQGMEHGPSSAPLPAVPTVNAGSTFPGAPAYMQYSYAYPHSHHPSGHPQHPQQPHPQPFMPIRGGPQPHMPPYHGMPPHGMQPFPGNPPFHSGAFGPQQGFPPHAFPAPQPSQGPMHGATQAQGQGFGVPMEMFGSQNAYGMAPRNHPLPHGHPGFVHGSEGMGLPLGMATINQMHPNMGGMGMGVGNANSLPPGMTPGMGMSGIPPLPNFPPMPPHLQHQPPNGSHGNGA